MSSRRVVQIVVVDVNRDFNAISYIYDISLTLEQIYENIRESHDNKTLDYIDVMGNDMIFSNINPNITLAEILEKNLTTIVFYQTNKRKHESDDNEEYINSNDFHLTINDKNNIINLLEEDFENRSTSRDTYNDPIPMPSDSQEQKQETRINLHPQENCVPKSPNKYAKISPKNGVTIIPVESSEPPSPICDNNEEENEVNLNNSHVKRNKSKTKKNIKVNSDDDTTSQFIPNPTVAIQTYEDNDKNTEEKNPPPPQSIQSLLSPSNLDMEKINVSEPLPPPSLPIQEESNDTSSQLIINSNITSENGDEEDEDNTISDNNNNNVNQPPPPPQTSQFPNKSNDNMNNFINNMIDMNMNDSQIPHPIQDDDINRTINEIYNMLYSNEDGSDDENNGNFPPLHIIQNSGTDINDNINPYNTFIDEGCCNDNF